MSKIKQGRPAVLSEDERRAKAAARQKEWRVRHPHSWERIWKRAYAKKKAKRERGVEVELVLP